MKPGPRRKSTCWRKVRDGANEAISAFDVAALQDTSSIHVPSFGTLIGALDNVARNAKCSQVRGIGGGAQFRRDETRLCFQLVLKHRIFKYFKLMAHEWLRVGIMGWAL